MDWRFIAKYIPLYREAAWLTVRIGFAGIAASPYVARMVESSLKEVKESR